MSKQYLFVYILYQVDATKNNKTYKFAEVGSCLQKAFRSVRVKDPQQTNTGEMQHKHVHAHRYAICEIEV